MEIPESVARKYIVNVNESKTLNNNVNDNVAHVDYIADKLVAALNNPDSRPYYCKVAWKLPEARIWFNLELALSAGRVPKNYFSWLCTREMRSS